MQTDTGMQRGVLKRLLGAAGVAAWRVPGRFQLANLIGPSYGLRCVVFHNISERETPFTRGIRVSIGVRQFESKLKFITTHYTPVSFEDVLQASNGSKLPKRAILVTFDDAYASVAEVAAPLCAQYKVPAVFFVNAAFVDNRRLAADNIVCYVASEYGIDKIRQAAQQVMGQGVDAPASVTDVFQNFFPNIKLAQRKMFLEVLLRLAGIDETHLAAKAGLYITSKQLRELVRYNFEFGNHTWTHVHCRSLTAEEMIEELDKNKGELETLSGRPVRAFSVPYGRSVDLTHEVKNHLRRSGHEAAFLSESVANGPNTGLFQLNRVSTLAPNDSALFQELEIYPRLRAVRNRYLRGARGTNSRIAATVEETGAIACEIHKGTS